MKERSPRSDMINTTSKLKPATRAASEPNLFPPIGSRHGNHNILQTLSGSREHEADVTLRHSGRVLPSRYVLYRKLGLVSKGERAVLENSPEVVPLRNRVNSTLRGKQPKGQAMQDNKKPEITKRSPFSMNGQELESSRAVRKKIEEFRHWHEEQYRLKLEALKARAVKENNGKIKAAEALALASMYKDKVTPLNQVKPADNPDHNSLIHDEATIKRLAGDEETALDSLPRLTSRGILHTSRQEQSNTGIERVARHLITPRPESPPAPIPSELRERVHSAKTWRTWRGINQSDAYNNVKTYIKDNDLLDGEKEKHIQSWVLGVEKAMLSGKCVGTNGQIIVLERQNSSLTSSSYTSDSS